MIKVTLIGTGNVASHFNEVFKNSESVQVKEVLSSRGDLHSKITKKRKEEGEPDIYIIAVSDDAISSVLQEFKYSKKLIVHTSGSVSMAALPKGKRMGVFYPLQSFSKDSYVDFKTIPICIEAATNEDLQLLKKMASAISNSVYEINSEQRKSLHLAAVFVNNFTNHMYQIGNELCEQNNVSFDILKPLISETAKKINILAPLEAQTGPARRDDLKTLAKQIAQLQNKNHQEIYKTITKSIRKTYEKKL